MNSKDADVVRRGRGKHDFRDHVSDQQSASEKNHRRGNNEPGRGDPLYRIDHLVVERKVIDQQNRNSGSRIEDERRPARPAIDSDLI